MDTFGNQSLLERRKVGFIAGSNVAPLSVLPAFDWAVETATRDDICIVSGFHSILERQVLDFLLKGNCGIICVLARSLYSKIPSVLESEYKKDRVLFITEEKQNRVSKKSAHRRNKLVADLSDELVTPIISPESSLSAIISSYNKPILTLKI